MDFKNITVAGSGTLGFQIAFQAAYFGFQVSLYDINEQIIKAAKAKFAPLSEKYKAHFKASDQQIKDTFNRLKYYTDLKQATTQADLLIEAIPENIKIKADFYEQLALVAPQKTIFATNSSTLLPSMFSKYTHRPEKFLALHFANDIYLRNTAEIMASPTTGRAVFEQVIAFAKQMGMVAIPIYKEQPGYILNTLLVPLLDAAMQLVVNQICDAPSVDKTWMIATGAPIGPFAIIDLVGIQTVYTIMKTSNQIKHEENKEKAIAYLKQNYIDKNHLGQSTLQGFYSYPDPAFSKADFLK